MSLRVFGCRKFRRLVSDRLDRELRDDEERFMVLHRGACAPCRLAEGQTALALNMLRDSVLEASPSVSFEDRVIRRWRVQAMRAKIGYWSPAALGAAIAGVAVLAALQMITQSSRLPNVRFQNPAAEARRVGPALPLIPDIQLLGNSRVQ